MVGTMSIAEVAARCAAAALVVVAFAACTVAEDEVPDESTQTREMLPEPPATEFDPGFIVSDDAFYDAWAMSEGEIQAFLESVSCRPDAGVERVVAVATVQVVSALAAGHGVVARPAEDAVAAEAAAGQVVVAGVALDAVVAGATV